MSAIRCATPLLVRAARLDDAAALHESCFADESFDTVAAYLEWCLAGAGRPTRLVAFVDERLVAHVELMPRQGGRWVELSSLVVAPGLRRRGIARRLVAAARRLARRWGSAELRLQVEARRTALIARYRRWGFRPHGSELNGRRWLTLPVESAPAPAPTSTPL